MTTGTILQRIRKQKNLTQEELAEILGVTDQSIINWELDKGYPETENLIKIATFYQVTIDSLVNPAYMDQPANQNENQPLVEHDEKVSKAYFLFTSFMLLLPPLAYGLSNIYFDGQYRVGVIINYIFMMIIVGMGIILVSQAKIMKPSQSDWMYLLYGVLANVVIFLFVFQVEMNIDYWVDIYMSTLAILLIHIVLVNHRKINMELFSISLILLIFYRLHLLFVFEKGTWDAVSDISMLQRLVYSSIPGIIVGIYLYKIIKYQVFDWYSGIYTLLTAQTLFLLMGLMEVNRYFMTIFLIMPFVFIIDLIVSKANRNFNPLKITFYLRMTTIMIIILLLYGSDYLTRDSYQDEEMYMFTFIMYATILINIIEYFMRHRIPQKKNLKSDYNI